jgi:hypothetical protein
MCSLCKGFHPSYHMCSLSKGFHPSYYMCSLCKGCSSFLHMTRFFIQFNDVHMFSKFLFRKNSSPSALGLMVTYSHRWASSTQNLTS